MENLFKRSLIIFCVIFTFCMMTISFAASNLLFTLDDVPSIVTIHEGTKNELPGEEEWTVVSGEKYVQLTDTNKLWGTKKGTAKIQLETSEDTYVVKVKVVAHKYDKTTNLCSCGAKRPAKTLKFKEDSYVFGMWDQNVDLFNTKYLNISPKNAVLESLWQVDTISSWYGETVAAITDNNELDILSSGTATITIIDDNSNKEATTNLIIFERPLQTQYEVHIGKIVYLPVADNTGKWEVTSGDNRIELSHWTVKGIKTGTAKLKYVTEVGEATTKVKVVNHKFDKTSGLCVCGAKQPPKTMKFTEKSYILESGKSIRMADKNFVIKPEGLIEDIEWEIETISSWDDEENGVMLATVRDDGFVRAKGAYGIAKLTAIHRESGKEASTYIFVTEDNLQETMTIHLGDKLELPRIENDISWKITSGGKRVQMYIKGDNQMIEAISTGTVSASYKTSVGITVKTKIKITKDHVYDKTTGVCACGAEKAPEVMKFNNTSYVFPIGRKEIEMSSSKYFTINPEDAIDNIEWEVETITDWYGNNDNDIVMADGEYIIPRKMGIAKMIARHEDSQKEVSTYIIIPSEEIPEEIIIHQGGIVGLPLIEGDIYWEVADGEGIAKVSGHNLGGLNMGTAKLTYETSIGTVLTTNVKVISSTHEYDESGYCECGENIYGLTDEMIDKIDELGIMSRYPDGTFGMKESISRGAVAAITTRLIGKSEEAQRLSEEKLYIDGYNETTGNYMWWNGFASLLSKLNLMYGINDEEFGGENNIKVIDFIKVILNVLEYDVNVEDSNSNSGYSEMPYIEKANELGLLNGIKDEGLSYEADLPKGVAAVIVYNALNVELKDRDVTLEDLVFSGGRTEFFVVSDIVAKKSGAYRITLADRMNEDVFYFTEDSEAEKWAMKYLKNESVIGSFVAVRLDENDEIVKIEVLTEPKNGLSEFKKTYYGYGNAYYAIEKYDLGSYDDKNKVIVNSEDTNQVIDVNDDATLVKLIYNATDNVCEFEFSKDLEEIDGIEEENITYVYDGNEENVSAKYVIIYEQIGERTELKNQVGRVIRIGNHSDGYKVIGLETEDGEKTDDYKFAGDMTELQALEDYALIVYNVTSDEFFEFVYGLDDNELNLDTETSAYVSEIETTRCVTLDGEEFDLDSKQNRNLYEDFVVVEINVVESSNDAKQYEIKSFQTFDYEDIKIKLENRIIIDEDVEVFIVIKGMDARKDDAPSEGGESTETTLTEMRFNSTSYVMKGEESRDMSDSKYFTIEPAEAIDDVKFSGKMITEWYQHNYINFYPEGVVWARNKGYENYLSGIAELTATHTPTDTTASTYLLVFNKEVQDEITIHVGEGISSLPLLEKSRNWVSSDDNIATTRGITSLDALSEGEVTLTYNTSIGIPVTMKVKVTNGCEDNENGYCACENTIYTREQLDYESIPGFNKNVVDVLDKYNIMTTYSGGDFKENLSVTKADCARILTATLNKTSEAEKLANKKVFSDGYDDTTGDVEWWNGYANFVAESGVIKGYPDGTFRGNRKVNIAEFITMVVRTLGYGEVVELNGTWPTNYLVKANELGLLEGTVYASYADTLTRDIAAVILYNALQTEMYGEGITLAEFSFGETIKVLPTQEIQEKLLKYNIITNNTTSYFNRESERIGIAKNIIKILDLTDVVSNITSESKFSDITAGTTNARYANLISELEIMKGFDDGTFLPDEALTNIEFVTCIVKALGYKNLKDTEYIQKANELGLLNNIPSTWKENDILTNGFAAVVFYNMLDCKLHIDENRESKSTIEEMLAYEENGAFGAIVSDGLYKSAGIWYVDLGDRYDDVQLYEIESAAVTTDIISKTENYYEDVEADKIKPFIYYLLNSDGVIEKIEFLADGNEYGKYIVEELDGYTIDSNERINNLYNSKLTSETQIIPIVDYYDGEEYRLSYDRYSSFESLKYCTGDTFVLYNIACPEYVTHIFVINKENEVFVDEVTKTKISSSIPYLEVNGEMLEIDAYPSGGSEKLIEFVNDLRNSGVIYTRNEDVLSLIDYYKPNMLCAHSAYDEVVAINESDVTFKNNKTANTVAISLTNEETIAKYKDAIFVLFDATIDVNGEVVFEDYEVLGKGVENAELEVNDRVITHINSAGVTSVAIVRGLATEDIVIRTDIRKVGRIDKFYNNSSRPYLIIDETTFYIANDLGYDNLQSLVGSFIAYDSYYGGSNYITSIECDFGEYELENVVGIVSSIENDIVSFATEGWPDLDLNNPDNIKEYKNATVVEIYITEDADGNAIFDATKKHEVLGLGLENTNFEKGDRVILGCDVIAILKGLELPEDTDTPAEEPDEGENGNNPEQTPGNNENGEETGETTPEDEEHPEEEIEGVEESQRQVCKIILKDYLEGDTYTLGDQILVELESEDEALVTIGEGSKMVSTETELVVYIMEVQSESEVLCYISGLDLKQLNPENNLGDYVNNTNGRDADLNYNGEEWIYFDDEDFENIYGEFTIIDVTVEENDEFPEAPYRVKTFGIVDYSEFKLQVADRIFIDNESETMFIVHGMPEK